jgi:predicted nucleic acid-binding protein
MTPIPEALVVDASVAAKWHLKDEEEADKALLLLQRFTQGKVELFAPDYIRYEVAAAITFASSGRRPRIQPELAREAIAAFLALGLNTLNSNQLILESFPLVQQYNCALYDGFYLALKNRLNLPFITADRKLYLRIQHLPAIIWLGDYSPAEEN